MNPQSLTSFLVLAAFAGPFLFPFSAHSASSPAVDQLVLGPKIQEELDFIKEETVVSAARYEQPISQAPSNVYVITAEDIRHSGATDIPTLLRRVPGMEVIQMTGAHYDVSVRGDNQERANKLLAMVDGRPIYVDHQGLVFWKALPVTLQEIERIEVVKGPVSALYGFNAFDGIVNIITKSPRDGGGTFVQVVGGELDTLTASAVQRGQLDNLSYRLSAGWDQNNQWRNRQALAYRSYKFNSSFDYELSNSGLLKLEAGTIDVNRYDGPTGEIVLNNQPFTQSYVRAGYEKEGFFIRTFWAKWDSDLDIATLSPLAPFIVVADAAGNSNGIPFISNTYDVETQYTKTLGSTTRLIGGLNFRHSTLSSTQISKFEREYRFGVYAHIETKLTSRITINAGTRLDLHNEINPTYSPRLALLFTPQPDHTIRISGAIAYRPPTIVETSLNLKQTTTVFGFTTITEAIGSKNLRPERILSTEIEYQGWSFRHRLRTRLSFFYNHLSDLIGFVTVPTPPPASSPDNFGEANIYGGEASLEFLATPWLTGFGNASYQQLHQTIPGEVQRGAPQWKFNGGLRAKGLNGLSGEIVLHRVSSATYPINGTFPRFVGFGLISPSAVPNNRVPSYTLVNLRGAYRFWQDRAEVAITIYNALNDRHREHPLGDIIGSRVLGWLTITM